MIHSILLPLGLLTALLACTGKSDTADPGDGGGGDGGGADGGGDGGGGDGGGTDGGGTDGGGDDGGGDDGGGSDGGGTEDLAPEQRWSASFGPRPGLNAPNPFSIAMLPGVEQVAVSSLVRPRISFVDLDTGAVVGQLDVEDFRADGNLPTIVMAADRLGTSVWMSAFDQDLLIYADSSGERARFNPGPIEIMAPGSGGLLVGADATLRLLDAEAEAIWEYEDEKGALFTELVEQEGVVLGFAPDGEVSEVIGLDAGTGELLFRHELETVVVDVITWESGVMLQGSRAFFTAELSAEGLSITETIEKPGGTISNLTLAAPGRALYLNLEGFTATGDVYRSGINQVGFNRLLPTGRYAQGMAGGDRLGRVAVTAEADGSVVIHDGTVDIDHTVLMGIGADSVLDLPDGSLLVVSRVGNSLTRLDDGVVLAESLDDELLWPSSAAMADGSLAVLNHLDFTVSLRDPLTLEALGPRVELGFVPNFGHQFSTLLALPERGQLAAIHGGSGTVVLLDATTLDEVGRVEPFSPFIDADTHSFQSLYSMLLTDEGLVIFRAHETELVRVDLDDLSAESFEVTGFDRDVMTLGEQRRAANSAYLVPGDGRFWLGNAELDPSDLSSVRVLESDGFRVVRDDGDWLWITDGSSLCRLVDATQEQACVDLVMEGITPPIVVQAAEGVAIVDYAAGRLDLFR